MGLTGSFGGMLAGWVTIAGLVRRQGNVGPKVRALAIVLTAQIPWLVPGLVVYAQGTRIAGSGSFSTDLGGVGGPLRLLAGHGFWQRGFQVGGTTGIAAPLLGVALLGLALIGHRRLLGDLNRLGWLAGVALAWALASGLSSTRGVYATLTSWPGGAMLREGQRILVPALLWMAVAVASSLPELTRRAGRGAEVLGAAPVAVVALLVAPGVWGAGGQMRSVDLPAGWEEAREIVRADVGPVLALPWFEYLELEVADGRTVLNPLPIWLGGDVLTSSDPRLPGEAASERRDPREGCAAELVAQQPSWRTHRGYPRPSGFGGSSISWMAICCGADRSASSTPRRSGRIRSWIECCPRSTSRCTPFGRGLARWCSPPARLLRSIPSSPHWFTSTSPALARGHVRQPAAGCAVGRRLAPAT